MDSNHLKQLEEEGFFILKNSVDQETINTYQKEFERVVKMKNLAIKENYFYLAHTLSDNFYDFINQNPAQDYIDKIIGDTCIIHSFNGITLKPNINNPIQNKIHRDTQRFSRPYLLSLQQILILDDFTIENGGTYFLPKSHLRPEKPSDEYFYKNAIQVEAKKGDIVVFDSLTWHCGGTNNTLKQRRALTLVFTRSFMKQQIDLTLSLTREVKNEKTRRLLGFNSRVPTNIEEFNLPESERLYKPNQG